MDSSIIIKLLAHYLQDDGRTLVALSGVNLLWRKLLKRDPDGALFSFCKKACERIFWYTHCPKHYIGLFFFHLQYYHESMTLHAMICNLVVSDAPECLRPDIQARLSIHKCTFEGKYYIVNREDDSWNYIVMRYFSDEKVWRDYYNYIWTGKKEDVYFSTRYYRPPVPS